MKINEGDEVTIFVDDDTNITGQVQYTPCATGDCWRIFGNLRIGGITIETSKIFYVQTFRFIMLVRKRKVSE